MPFWFISRGIDLDRRDPITHSAGTGGAMIRVGPGK
jgi:hypothetical protein